MARRAPARGRLVSHVLLLRRSNARLTQDCTINVLVARQRTAQRDVDCQPSTREAREILVQNPTRRVSVAGTGSLLDPACSHARRSVNVHRRTATFTNHLSDGKGQMQAFQHQDTEQMRSDGEFRCCRPNARAAPALRPECDLKCA